MVRAAKAERAGVLVDVDTSDLIRDFDRWAPTVPPIVATEAASMAEDLRSQLAEEVPYDTGTLSGSAEATHISQRFRGGFGLALGQSAAQDYAGFIEFGAYGGEPVNRAGRYLYPLGEASHSAFIDLATQAVQRSLDSFPWTQQG